MLSSPRRWIHECRRHAVALGPDSPVAAATLGGRGAGLLRLAPPLIFLVTIGAFLPSLQNGFVWDDQENFLENLEFRGLAWENLRWMATTTLMGHWIPLTWLTFGVDYLLWGMNPFGYHLTNVLLHALCAVVFYLVALRLLRAASAAATGIASRVGAAAAALLFALHPLRVESVTWLTERRDVLAGLWFLLALLLYLVAAAASRARRRWLLASVGCYVLAVGSKAIVMGLPLILVVLDCYPLRRLPRRAREWSAPAVRPLWMEKLPYVALALVAAAMAVHAQTDLAEPLADRPLPGRISVALYGLGFYVVKTVLPFGISPIFPLPPRVDPFAPAMMWSALGVAAATTVLLLLRRRFPSGLAVWACYAVLLAPVSGLTQSGPQLVAARYSYLSCLGWALLAGAAVSSAAHGIAAGRLRRSWGVAGGIVLVAGLAALGTLTWRLTRVWRDERTLWTYALTLDRTAYVAHHNLSMVLLAEDEERIREDLDRLGTDDESVLADQIPVLLLRGRHDEVKRVRERLGHVLLRKGKTQEAVDLFLQEVAAEPDDPTVHNNLGLALLAAGDARGAAESFKRALEIDPGYEAARANLEEAVSR